MLIQYNKTVSVSHIQTTVYEGVKLVKKIIMCGHLSVTKDYNLVTGSVIGMILKPHISK